MVTVLVADDSDYIRNTIKTIVAESGHSVICEAKNGDDAITQYKELKPDIVLMDIVLEAGTVAKTGLDAIREIISFDPQAKVIVCSGLDEQLLINESMSAGAKAFVAKPIEPNKLLQTIIMCSDLRIIAEMGKLGAERAASILSKITKQPIQVELMRLEAGSPRLFAGFIGTPDRFVTAIRMGLQTKPDCDAFLVFENQETAKIANIMSEIPGGSVNQEIQKSAIKELGSNVICSFFAAIADFAEFPLIPSAPTLQTDSFETIINSYLARRTTPVNSALIFQIQLKRKTGSADGFLVIFPSSELQNQLIVAGKKSFNLTEIGIPAQI